MEPLYETTTDFTLEMYMKIYKKAAKKAFGAAFGIAAVVLIFIILRGFMSGNYAGVVVVLAVFAAALPVSCFAINKELKNNYNSYKAMSGSLINYRFYDGYYET
ncbi:MAG: hypothetical protein LUD81_10980, partial [Clostridiales bacterium]|nr:hypothetical protein [Clostridiales bacterium]